MKRKNVEKCRSLRKKQTDAESRLWAILRNRNLDGIKFRRQFPAGNYILDFYAPELKVGIEVDGGQHYIPGNIEYDSSRTEGLEKYGIRILRVSNHYVTTNPEGVAEMILSMPDKNPLTLGPLPGGERKRTFSPPGRRQG